MVNNIHFRNKFIASYYQGTVAFVNEYWKMIHRAAGWDALRYWLLVSYALEIGILKSTD